jgi:hypothetical protein
MMKLANVGSVKIQPSAVVRDLGVLLDGELTMKQHVGQVAQSFYYQLRRLRQIRRYAGQDIALQLISAFVLSRLDYCNSVLSGLPKSTLSILQHVQNAAARLVLDLSPRDHITHALRQLQWLPVEYRIQFKMCLLMHLAHTGQAPAYITDILKPVATNSLRPGLRSASLNNMLNLGFGQTWAGVPFPTLVRMPGTCCRQLYTALRPLKLLSVILRLTFLTVLLIHEQLYWAGG